MSDQAEADEALAPFRTNPVLERALLNIDAEPTTLAEQQRRQLADNPEGHRWVVDNAWLRGSADRVVPAMRRIYTTPPNDLTFTIWFSMAPLRELPDMAFSLQSEIYLASYVLWKDPADDDANREWLRQAMTDLEPVTVGQYLGDSDLATRQLRFMSEENWRRLQEIRAVRDPDGASSSATWPAPTGRPIPTIGSMCAEISAASHHLRTFGRSAHPIACADSLNLRRFARSMGKREPRRYAPGRFRNSA